MATPTMITVQGTYLKPDGTPESGYVRLISSTFIRDSASDDVVVPGELRATLDVSGNVSLPVPATDDPAWSPVGWTYDVTVQLSGGRHQFTAAIPYSTPGGVLDLTDLIPSLPSDGELYAPISHTHEGGGGGGAGASPSGTVAASVAFGQVPAAGASANYSRSDHVHGTPAAPTPASIGASPTAHTHSAYADATATTNALASKANISSLATVATTGDYNDLINKPVGGAGSGTAPTFVRAHVTSGDIVMTTDASWTIVPGLSLALPAVVGDDVELVMSCMVSNGPGADNFYDLAVISGGAIRRVSSSGSVTPAIEGDPSMYPDTDINFRGTTSLLSFTVTADDLDSGNVTFGILHKGPGGGTPKIYASTAYPFRWRARNDH